MTAPSLEERAWRIRRNVVRMAAGKGEGYVGQGLQSAELLAVAFFEHLDWDAGAPRARDRFILSAGHYSIALYAALAEAGAIDEAELDTYGLDGSRLIMSTDPGLVDGVEICGGSLGQGLSVGCGLALAQRLARSAARTFVYLTDGELQEGSVWEAAMLASHLRLDGLSAVVDVNRTQADGELVLEIEPIAEKFRAFGWHAIEVDGNDLDAVRGAFASLRVDGAPGIIVAHTQIGAGVRTIATRERAHFVRVGADEWDLVRAELEAGRESA